MENKDLKPNRGGQTLSDEQMKDVSGGGIGQMIEGYRPKDVPCKYCSISYSPSKIIEHEKQCSKNPANSR